MTKGKYIIMVLILVALAGGAFALTQKKDKDKEPAGVTASRNTEAGSSTAGNGVSEQSANTSTITYTDDGFSPSTITVKTGTTVIIKNEASHALQFDSDPHPAHTGNTELNVNNVPTGGNETFTVKRTGTFGYHNHLNPSDTGTIIVE